MAQNLIDLRRRIKAVKNTQKTTKAMKTVSAAKLRRGVSEIHRNLPILKKIESVLKRVGDASGSDHPFLQERRSGKTVIVAISGDKGLCGVFNSRIIARTEAYYRELLEPEGDNVSLVLIGNKIIRHMAKRNYPIRQKYESIMTRLNYQNGLDLSQYLQAIYLDPAENIKSIRFVFTEFASAAKQEVNVTQLFPIRSESDDKKDVENNDIDYIFEPSAAEIFKTLLPKYIDSMVYQSLLQSSASEHAARMVAMDLATKNATEMIRTLTLTMNKMRQASITKELLEIITATEALAK